MSLLNDNLSRHGVLLCVAMLLFFVLDRIVQVRLATLLLLLFISVAASMICRPTLQNALRAVAFWVTFAWLYRVRYVGLSYELGGLFRDVQTLSANPFVDSYFPTLLSNVPLYGLIHLVIPVAGLAILVFGRPKRYKAYAGLLLGLSFLAMVHQYGVANQMATTTFWVSAMMLFFLSWEKPTGIGLAFVGQVIVSFIFLGAFLGKLTPEYWSNGVTDKLGQVSKLPIQFLGAGQLAILFEGATGFSFLLTPKLAAVFCLFTISGMFITVSPAVIDATGPLVGVCMSTLILTRIPKQNADF